MPHNDVNFAKVDKTKTLHNPCIKPIGVSDKFSSQDNHNFLQGLWMFKKTTCVTALGSDLLTLQGSFNGNSQMVWRAWAPASYALLSKMLASEG